MDSVSASSDRARLLQFVLGASVFIFVVAANKTNIETKFWTSYLASEGWGMETDDMQFAQYKILFEVSRFPVRFPVTRPNVPRPTEIPDTVNGAKGATQFCSHCWEECHIAPV
jgi:hypothetical protein